MRCNQRLTELPAARTKEGNSSGMTYSAPGKATARRIHDTSGHPVDQEQDRAPVSGVAGEAVRDRVPVKKDLVLCNGCHTDQATQVPLSLPIEPLNPVETVERFLASMAGHDWATVGSLVSD